MSFIDERKMIDGAAFEKMIFGGVANLQANLQEVNDLNVFPVPDGDTGENMFLTLQGGFERLKKDECFALCDKAYAMAQGMLLGARGNSGVILSQLFYGLSEGLAGLDYADLLQFSNALKTGVKCAYNAVAHPVEGTILTVAREAVENICVKLHDEMTVEEFFAGYLTEMKKSLQKTPDLLAVLKESGVIDSGGAGLVYITEGFCKALGGAELLEEISVSSASSQKTLDFSKFNENSVMEFGYCTELLLQLQHAKTDIANFSVGDLIAFLETVGDSIVAFQTGTIVKVHVHTLTPWQVLEHCQKFGEFLTVKIENMTLQHDESADIAAQTQKSERRKYATVTVATGDGLKQTFLDMGADYVIAGGQTNNPSADDFIHAFEEVNAEYIFVLPNNGNVVLAAKQAAKMYEKADVRVVESKNIGQGYSALSMLDYGLDDPDGIASMLWESMQNTTTGMIAKAVRTTSVNGVEVEKDGYMGFTDHTMLTCQKTKLAALTALLEKLNVKDKDYAIIVYGKTVTDEEKAAVQDLMQKEYPDTEAYEIYGGQEVYDLLVIVEE